MDSIEVKVSQLIIFLIITLYSCTTDQALVSFSSDKAEITAYNLISPKIANKWASENPDSYIVVQISKNETFLKEHIPNAQNIWRPDYGSDNTAPYGGLRASSDKIENLLQTLGYENGKTLLLYDIKANVDALRFAWLLNLYGFDEFKIINAP